MAELAYPTDLTLSPDELVKITGYTRASNQLRVLGELGIPARRRPDNSVLVMRMHCLHPVAMVTNQPKLKPIRK